MLESPIAHARQCLDDQLSLLETADSRDRLRRAILGLVRACQRNPYLRTVVDAYETDNCHLDDLQEQQRSNLWSQLDEIVTLANNQDAAFSTAESAGWTAQRLRDALKARESDSPPQPLRPYSHSKLLATLRGLELLLCELHEASPARKGCSAALSQHTELTAKVRWIDRERENARYLSASRIWAELLQIANLASSPPGEDALRHWLDQSTSGLFGTDNVADCVPTLECLRRDVVDRAQTLVVELRFRLGVRATHDAALRRYSWGAVTFRRGELRRMAEDDTRQAELLLTADAAKFLFAEGFDVLTEVSLDAVRLDLVSFGDALLIEAKRYGLDRHRTESAARRIVYDGARQLHDYSSRFRHRDLETDNFLLVFRLGGVRLDLPREVAVANTRLRFQLVDLAPAAESGSNSPRVVVVTPEEIAEEVEARVRAHGTTGAR